MKIILSRKGFDSTAGGCASPIFCERDGAILSLPIPTADAPTKYQHIQFANESIGFLVEGLTAGQHRASESAHLDPDLRRESIDRLPGWRPSFGQNSSAQSHLSNMGVTKGDLFLFFGWFREAVLDNQHWVYNPGSPDLQVIFGWLQVDEVLPVGSNLDQVVDTRPWLKAHPHLHAPEVGQKGNVIYIASDRLSVPGLAELNGIDGGGVFERISGPRKLTCPDQNLRSIWCLPSFFHPKQFGRQLTYHRDIRRWTPVDSISNTTVLRSVSRGQEFVTSWNQSTAEIDWLKGVFAS